MFNFNIDLTKFLRTMGVVMVKLPNSRFWAIWFIFFLIAIAFVIVAVTYAVKSFSLIA